MNVALSEEAFRRLSQIVRCALIVDAMGGPENALWEVTATFHSLVLGYPPDDVLTVTQREKL